MNAFSTPAHQKKSQALTQNSLLIISRYRLFHEKAKKSAAVEKFCAHGGRYIFWLPYRFKVPITIFISCNVTHTGVGMTSVEQSMWPILATSLPSLWKRCFHIDENHTLLLDTLIKIDAKEKWQLLRFGGRTTQKATRGHFVSLPDSVGIMLSQ